MNYSFLSSYTNAPQIAVNQSLILTHLTYILIGRQEISNIYVTALLLISL